MTLKGNNPPFCVIRIVGLELTQHFGGKISSLGMLAQVFFNQERETHPEAVRESPNLHKSKMATIIMNF